jgi:hypothetical protein
MTPARYPRAIARALCREPIILASAALLAVLTWVWLGQG